MSLRPFALALALVVTSSAVAAADVVVAGGGGAAIVANNPCSFEDPQPCTATRERATGAAPMLRVSWRNHTSTTGIHFRYGGSLAGFAMVGGGSSGDMASVTGEVGVQLDRASLDVSSGIADLRLHADGMSTITAVTFVYGMTLGFELRPGVNVFGRVELDAVLEGATGAAFAGGGLEWRL